MDEGVVTEEDEKDIGDVEDEESPVPSPFDELKVPTLSSIPVSQTVYASGPPPGIGQLVLIGRFAKEVGSSGEKDIQGSALQPGHVMLQAERGSFELGDGKRSPQ